MIATEIRHKLDQLKPLGILTTDVVKAVDNMNIASISPFFSREKLIELYETAKDIDAVDEDSLPLPRTIYSDINMLNSTLHERANKEYSPEITTYKLTEPDDDFLERMQIGYVKSKQNL